MIFWCINWALMKQIFSDPYPYKTIVGVLQYATLTRLESFYTVNKSTNLSPSHLRLTGVCSKESYSLEA